jgi:GntR family transcriptional repressor for pyruvate dehydrogenase complex
VSADTKFSPIQRTTAAQAVANQILREIRRGVLRPGQQLPTERDLMQQLNVGRSSVREALQILATLNLIDVRPGSGTFVRQPQAAEVFRPELFGLLIANSAALELMEARLMVEPTAVRLACVRATTEDLNEMEALLHQHERALRANKPVNVFAAEFHVLLAKAAHNQIVAGFMESIIGLLMARGRKVERITGYARTEVKEHHAILQLVRDQDVEAAAAVMRAHIIDAAQTYDTAGIELPDFSAHEWGAS